MATLPSSYSCFIPRIDLCQPRWASIGEEVLLLDANRRPVLVVHRVAERHDRVQTVVAAEPLEDHEDSAGGAAGGGPARLAQDVRHRPDAAEEAESEPAGADPHHVAT